jgi:hypothetical protein
LGKRNTSHRRLNNKKQAKEVRTSARYNNTHLRVYLNRLQVGNCAVSFLVDVYSGLFLRVAVLLTAKSRNL